MTDMETIIKNYGYIIRNPRQTKFIHRQFGKVAFLNKNKHPYKQVVNDLHMDFINSKKIFVTKNVSDKFMEKPVDRKTLFEDFLPYYDNQIIIIEYKEETTTNYMGYWIRDKKTHYVISSFFYLKNGKKFNSNGTIVEGNGLVNYVADWGISKTKNLWKSHWENSSSTHGNNINLLHSWFQGAKGAKDLINFYLTYTKPFQHWSLKNPIDNPQVREIDFKYREEIMSAAKTVYFIHTLNNLTKRQECIEIEPEERLANLRNKKPTAYQYKVLNIGNVSNSTNYVYNRSVNKNKFHTVRGFERQYKSGKIVWIKNHTRGDKKLGVVEKDYIVSKFKKTDEHNDNHVKD